MKPFLDLLPFRIDQAIGGRPIRAFRVARQRRKTAPSTVSMSSLAVGDPRRLYIDLAAISRHDAGTGIQRVVRALALALLGEAPESWDIRFVAADRRRAYHTISWPELAKGTEVQEVKGRPGDVFLGLDFSLDTVRRHSRQLAKFRRDGGSLWFLIYDLLPADRPEWFSSHNVVRYKAWLEVLGGIAEGFLCISQQTAIDLERVLSERFNLCEGYRTSVVPMGCSIKESMLRSAEVVESFDTPMRFNTSAPFSLMVGTLEPRKGHSDILAGFSELWRQEATGQGTASRLVLVGRMGWHTEGLRDAIRTHPHYGRNLLWFDDVEDLELERIYQASQGVIIGSHAEGFGLPLIEALGHDKPVLARDLPIFRTHEDLGVRYFPSDASPTILADCIREWTNDVQAGLVKVTRPNASWKEAARTVLSAIR